MVSYIVAGLGALILLIKLFRRSKDPSSYSWLWVVLGICLLIIGLTSEVLLIPLP